MDKKVEIKRGEGAFVELLNQEMKELQESQKQIEEMVRIIQNAVGGCAKHWAELIAVALKKEGYAKNSSVALDYMDVYKQGFKDGVEALKIQAKERKFEIVTDAGNREDVVFVEDIDEIIKELCE